jgi:uncharacterized protein
MKLATKSIAEITEKYKIKMLIYFGSYHTEYFNYESDIDIAFLSSGALDSSEQLQLLEDLIIFHRKSEIDLVDLQKADPLLRYEVAVNGKVFYEEEPDFFDRYALFYIKQYYELKPVIQAEMKQIKNAIREVLQVAESRGYLPKTQNP